MRKLLVYILILPTFFLACANQDNSEVSVDEVTIVYSGNIGGRKDLCGCKPALGGFARRSTVISNLRTEYENLLVFDSGALLYLTNFLIPPQDHIYRLEAPVSARVMDQIGIEAVNVSSMDLSNSVDSLSAIDKATSFPWISSNLTWRDSGDLVFTPDISVTKGNLRIGVFGIMADNYMGTVLFDEETPLEVLDPIETARSEVKKLEQECDLIIALAYVNRMEVKKLNEQVPGIDIIIHSHNGYHNPTSDHNAFKPQKTGNAIILQSPDGGRVLSYVTLQIVNKSTVIAEITEEDYIRQKKAENLIGIEKDRLSSTFTNYFIDLVAEIKPDDEIQEQLDAVDTTIQTYKDQVGI